MFVPKVREQYQLTSIKALIYDEALMRAMVTLRTGFDRHKGWQSERTKSQRSSLAHVDCNLHNREE